MTIAQLTAAAPTHQPSPLQQAVEEIAPRWHAWILQTLAHGGEMTLSDLHHALPMVNPGTLHNRLAALADSRLITRRPGGDGPTTYAATVRARLLEPVLDRAEAWTRTHRPSATPLARAQAAEDALAPLAYSYTTDALTLLRRGPAQRPDLLQVMPAGTVYARLATLEEHGLITRSRDQRQFLFHLTDAGRGLSPVLDALNDWAHGRVSGSALSGGALAAHRAAGATAVAASPAAGRTSVPKPEVAQPSRAEVARLRQATTRLVFSHRPGPQPAPLIPSSIAAPTPTLH